MAEEIRAKRRRGKTRKRPEGKADLGCSEEDARGAAEAAAEDGQGQSRTPCRWRATSGVRLAGCSVADATTPTTPNRVDISGSRTDAHLRLRREGLRATRDKAASETRRPIGTAATTSRSARRARPDVADVVVGHRVHGTRASMRRPRTEMNKC